MEGEVSKVNSGVRLILFSLFGLVVFMDHRADQDFFARTPAAGLTTGNKSWHRTCSMKQPAAICHHSATISLSAWRKSGN